jgi:hypothetical protein
LYGLMLDGIRRVPTSKPCNQACATVTRGMVPSPMFLAKPIGTAGGTRYSRQERRIPKRGTTPD